MTDTVCLIVCLGAYIFLYVRIGRGVSRLVGCVHLCVGMGMSGYVGVYLWVRMWGCEGMWMCVHACLYVRNGWVGYY